MDDDLASVFDEDADLYDRARPGYPGALITDLVRLGGFGPGSRVLEIGPGTGQATVDLVAAGLSVTAVERGSSLAATLRDRAGPDVTVVTGTFEDAYLHGELFDGVVAFTSWHWLDRVVRAPKVHSALRSRGSLATVTTSHVLGGTGDFFEEVQGCYERWDPATPPGLRLTPAADVPEDTDEVDGSSWFERPVRLRYEQELTYSTRQYLDLLGTYSGHRALDPGRRDGLLSCIAALIDQRYDGVLSKRYLHELRVARRSVP